MSAIKSTKSILSLEKALNILELMSNHNAPMRLQDIAQAVGIPASTALRLIYTLQSRGYINQDPASSRYYLSLKLFNLGSRISDNLSISEIARPHLKALSAQLGRSANLAVAQGNQVFIIDVVGGSSESHVITTRPGRTIPMHCTSLGRALMFDFTPAQIEEYWSATQVVPYTPLTVLDREALAQELERSRLQGYTYDPGEYRPGIAGLGAPILDNSGHPIASISVAELSSVITPEMIQAFSAALIHTARDISKQV